MAIIFFWVGGRETRRAMPVRTYFYNNENGFEKLWECEYICIVIGMGRRPPVPQWCVGGLCVFKGLKRPTHKGPF